MASISIRDSLNAEIISANPQVNSGFAKYLKGTAAQLVAGADFAGQFRKELPLVDRGETGFGLSFSNDVPLGADKVSLTVTAGAKAVIGVYNRKGMLLFENTVIGAPVTVPGGQAYVAFSFRPSLEVALKQESGNLSFGLTAGTEGEFRCYQPFDVTGATVSLADACKSVLENFTIPNTVDDLKQMKGLPAGAIACVSGHGRLQIGCSVDFAAAFNPLASVANLSKLGKVNISSGMSVSAGFQATASGDFQMRVQKMDGSMVRLSYHKVAARELEVSLSAKGGPGITVGDKDLLKMLFGGADGLSGTSEEDLAGTGIYPEGVHQLSEDSLGWRPPSRYVEPVTALHFGNLRFAGDPSLPADERELIRQAEALWEFVTRPHVAEEFGIATTGVAGAEPCIIQSIRTSRRVGPDGQVLFDLVAELTQRRVVTDPVTGAAAKFLGGCTVIVGPEGEIRYIISKNVRNEDRLRRQIEYQRNSGFWMNENGQYKMRGYAHTLVHNAGRP